MSSEIPTDQGIKALQAQNAQFQEMFLNLAKGQEDLKTLILKEKKKKKKVVLLNMGHKFGNRLDRKLICIIHLKEERIKRKKRVLAL